MKLSLGCSPSKWAGFTRFWRYFWWLQHFSHCTWPSQEAA